MSFSVSYDLSSSLHVHIPLSCLVARLVRWSSKVLSCTLHFSLVLSHILSFLSLTLTGCVCSVFAFWMHFEPSVSSQQLLFCVVSEPTMCCKANIVLRKLNREAFSYSFVRLLLLFLFETVSFSSLLLSFYRAVGIFSSLFLLYSFDFILFSSFTETVSHTLTPSYVLSFTFFLVLSFVHLFHFPLSAPIMNVFYCNSE